MAVTAKVSIAMGQEELRLAKTAAKAAGISLSAFVTEGVRLRIADERRRKAALEVLATFGPEDFPTPDEAEEIRKLWRNPPASRASKKRPKKRR